ncbi:hypothetical protein FDUTEX481_01650 [Tolypothrix sp. PCC 7601]|nr:hypothetical protein FDUTEX481_01650 [Tolypothrix sp. PCC 7601]
MPFIFTVCKYAIASFDFQCFYFQFLLTSTVIHLTHSIYGEGFDLILVSI